MVTQAFFLSVDIGNPGSLCVTRDITQGKYREHMKRSLGLKICWKMAIKINEAYHVAACSELLLSLIRTRSFWEK